jgi:hypothetical protein
MTELIIVGAVSFVIGFLGAYAFDTFLNWRDERKWK